MVSGLHIRDCSSGKATKQKQSHRFQYLKATGSEKFLEQIKKNDPSDDVGVQRYFLLLNLSSRFSMLLSSSWRSIALKTSSFRVDLLIQYNCASDAPHSIKEQSRSLFSLFFHGGVQARFYRALSVSLFLCFSVSNRKEIQRYLTTTFAW